MAAIDERWFEALWEAYADQVLAYAWRRSDAETARDVVAGTFLVAWRRRDDVPDEPLPWLYGVARRVLADQFRSRKRQARVVERVGRNSSRASDADPSDEVAQRDAVVRALNRVNETDREALRLVSWEQLTPREAARVVGCSATTFSVRLHRARRRLRRHLDGAVEPTRPAPPEPSTDDAVPSRVRGASDAH